MAFQCTGGSSGLPVCSNFTNDDLWIATGRPLGDSISQCGSSVVYPVVSQCTDRILFGGHKVTSLPSLNPLCIQLVWRESFELSWFHLNCNPNIHKNYNSAYIQGMRRVVLQRRTSIHCRTVKSKYKLNLQIPVHLLLGVGVPLSCHFKLAMVLLCLTICAWVYVDC